MLPMYVYISISVYIIFVLKQCDYVSVLLLIKTEFEIYYFDHAVQILSKLCPTTSQH